MPPPMTVHTDSRRYRFTRSPPRMSRSPRRARAAVSARAGGRPSRSRGWEGTRGRSRIRPRSRGSHGRVGECRPVDLRGQTDRENPGALDSPEPQCPPPAGRTVLGEEEDDEARGVNESRDGGQRVGQRGGRERGGPPRPSTAAVAASFSTAVASGATALVASSAVIASRPPRRISPPSRNARIRAPGATSARQRAAAGSRRGHGQPWAAGGAASQVPSRLGRGHCGDAVPVRSCRGSASLPPRPTKIVQSRQGLDGRRREGHSSRNEPRLCPANFPVTWPGAFAVIVPVDRERVGVST